MHKDLSNTNLEGKKSAEIDYFIVLVGSILILTIVLAIAINQEWSEKAIQNAFNFITYEFGVLYIIIMNTALIFLGILAFGKKGKIILGCLLYTSPSPRD